MPTDSDHDDSNGLLDRLPSDIISSRTKRLLLVLSAIPLVVAAGYGFVVELLPWLAAEIGVLATFTLLVGVLAGIGIIPILGYGLPGVLPPLLAEPIANALWLVASIGLGPAELYQHADGSYEIRAADPDMEPVNHWGKFAGVPFVLNYERRQEIFGNYTENVATDVLSTDGGLPGGLVEYGPKRSGVKTAIDTKEVESGTVIRLHQVLERLQSACGVSEIDRAELDALTDHAGESGLDGRTQMWGVIVMGLAGAVMGYLTLF